MGKTYSRTTNADDGNTDTGTVVDAEILNCLGISGGGASLVGTISNSVDEVGVLAETLGIGGAAVERGSLAEHVGDTCCLQ